MNKDFVFTFEPQKRLFNYFKAGIPVLLEGSTGTLKTLFSQNVSKYSERKLISVNLSYETKLADLVGQHDCDDNSCGIIFHSKGPFIIAFEEGHTLLLERFDEASKEFIQFLEETLERRTINIELPGMPLKEIHMHKNCRFIATCELNRSSYHYKRYKLNERILTKFQVINFHEFTRHELVIIAQCYAARLNYKLPLKLIDNLFDFNMKLSKYEGFDSSCFTIREIFATIRALANNEDICETIMTIYGARYRKFIRERIRKMFTCYYSEFEYFQTVSKQFIYPKEFPNCFKNDSLSHALKSILFSLKNKCHVLLISDDGAGVTQLSRWILQYFNKINASDDFSKKNQEFFYICNEETNCSDLFGRQILSDTLDSNGKPIKWKSGFLTKAIKKGKIAVLDRINDAPETVIERLKEIMDQKFNCKDKYFEIPENPKKQKIEINQNFCLLCTCKFGSLPQSFSNRFNCIVLENQLEDISPTNLKELIKFLLHTTNFANVKSSVNQKDQNQSDKEDEDDFNDGLKSEIEASEVAQAQKQPEYNIAEQFNPTSAQINLVYNNIDKSMTMPEIAQFCRAVAKYIKFFEGNFDEELIVHFAKDMLNKSNDFSFKGKYEKLQEFLFSHLQHKNENDDDDEFFYQKSPLLCEFIAKLFAASIINLPICICGPECVGKSLVARTFASIRPCNSKNKFQMHTFNFETKPNHFYGTTIIKNRKTHFINGSLTNALINGETFIADDMIISSISALESIVPVLEPCIGQTIYMPCVSEDITINPEFFLIITHNYFRPIGHRPIPKQFMSQLRYFDYPKLEVADVSSICYDISQSFYKRNGGVPSFTKKQAMKVGEFMISINDLKNYDVPKWTFGDVKKLFQRIHFQDVYPDRFINMKIYHNILFYTMSSILYNDDEKYILHTVIDLIGCIFELSEPEKQKLQKCIEDLPRINKQKQTTYIMKGECGVMFNELSNTAFELKFPSLLNGIFMISLSHYSESILLIGPSGFKTFLSEYFLKNAEVITLERESTNDQLFGSPVFLTNSEAKIFYLEQICKICRIENKFSEFYEKMKEKQLKKEDITECINIFQFPASFQDALHRLIDKLFNYDKGKENKNDFSNITIEYQPGLFLSAILQGKSLVLKNVLNINPNEKLNELFSPKSIHNTFTSLILKELKNFNSNFRLFATFSLSSTRFIPDSILKHFSVICIPSYKPEEREIAIKNYISMKQLSFDQSLIHFIIDFSQSIKSYIRNLHITFSQMINAVEKCSQLNRNTENKESNVNQFLNLCIILYHLALDVLNEKEYLFNVNDKILPLLSKFISEFYFNECGEEFNFKNLNAQTPTFKMESSIDQSKKFYNSILEFLEETDGSSQYFVELCENMKRIEGDRSEMKQFLLIIQNISDNHHRDSTFIEKIKEIFLYYKEQIKQTLSNNEIFHIFENNKLIFHFLLKNDIITISEDICNYILHKIEPNGNRYCHFFYPELEKIKGEEQMKNIKEELLSCNPTAFDHFEEKRQEGENDSYICSLIRNDLVEEFIAYINRNNIPLYSEISPSIFETNSFLIDNKSPTLIEYSAFFGSIQIFRYLLMNNVKLTPSLWLYSIHSKNAELFHILESYRISRPIFIDNGEEDHSYLACLIESIKCHHNDFSEYIENNLMNQQKTKEKIILNGIKYHNYSCFKTDMNIKQYFYDLCLYSYNKIVDIFLKENEKEIEKKIIFIPNILIVFEH